MGLFDSISYHRLAQCIADDCQRYTDNLAAYGSCEEPSQADINFRQNPQKHREEIDQRNRDSTGAAEAGAPAKASDQKNQFYALSLGAMDWTYITQREATDYFRPDAYILGRKSRFYTDNGFDG